MMMIIIKPLIITVLLLAVIAAGAKTISSPPRNETASPPPTAAAAKTTSSPPRNEPVSPPPTAPAPKTTSLPPRNETFSPPPTAAAPKRTSSPPRNETFSPPPTAAAPKRTSSPPRNGNSSPPPRAAAAEGPNNCLDELVKFSKCLPYISSSPNNTTDSPSRQCCNDVTSSYLSRRAVCYCYLVQKPGLLGFPLNSTRIFSLSSLCPIRNHGTRANFSLKSICSGTNSLPPISSITVPGRPKPHISDPALPVRQPSGPANPTPPTGVNFSEETTADSGTAGKANNHSHPAPAFQVFPAWRTFSINKSAGLSLPWWLLIMLLPMFSIDCR